MKTPDEQASTLYGIVTESRLRVQKMAATVNTDSKEDYQRASLALLTEIHALLGVIAIAAVETAYH
jgi:hypothetical protein